MQKVATKLSLCSIFLIGLSACVAPSQGALNSASAACGAGDRTACKQVPALNAQVQQENINNQVGAALGAAVVGGALAAPYYGPGYGPGYYHPGYYRYGRYYGCGPWGC